MKHYLLPLVASALVIVFSACQDQSTPADSAMAATPTSSSSAAQGADSPVMPERNSSTPQLPKYQAEAESLESTVVEFEGEVFDFGEVPEGTKVSHQFVFTNTGEHPLKLTRVKASCGCTTPRYSKEAIGPGEKGYIDVEFDSSGKPGFQNKSVTVTGNFSDGVNKILRIKGQVKSAGA